MKPKRYWLWQSILTHISVANISDERKELLRRMFKCILQTDFYKAMVEVERSKTVCRKGKDLLNDLLWMLRRILKKEAK